MLPEDIDNNEHFVPHYIPPEEEQVHEIVKEGVEEYHDRQKQDRQHGGRRTHLSRLDEGLVDLYDTDKDIPDIYSRNNKKTKLARKYK
jgi:restriction endonuclease Mrr